jgi:hypothetical protein
MTDRLAAAGYGIERGRSDWRLAAADSKLIAMLAEGWAGAVAETGEVPAAEIANWLAARKAAGVSCLVRHEDFLAWPSG